MFDGGRLRRTGRCELQPDQIEFDAPLYAVLLPSAGQSILIGCRCQQREICSACFVRHAAQRTPYPGRMSTTEEFEARVRVDFAKSLTGQEQIRKCNPRSAFSQS